MSDTTQPGEDTAYDPVPGARDPLQRAVESATADVAQQYTNGAAAVGSAAADLRLSYEDISALAGSMTTMSGAVAPLVGAAASVAWDGDLLASAILSPGTAAAAELAASTTATALGASVVTVDSLSIMVSSAVASYQLVDTALAAGAASAADVAAVYAGYGKVIAASVGELPDRAAAVGGTATLVIDSVLSAAYQYGGEAVAAGGQALAETFDDMLVPQNGSTGRSRPPGQQGSFIRFWQHFADDYDGNAADAAFFGHLQSTLGGLGAGYDHTLTGLIDIGAAFGLFTDGDAQLLRATDPVPVPASQRSEANADSRVSSIERLYGAEAAASDDGTLLSVVRGSNDIEPTDTASMLASLAQIDSVGGSKMADIRIFTVHDANGTAIGYRVQVPSTQSWDPLTFPHSAPNDLTSDMYAISQGDTTALAQSVYKAMEAAHIPTTAPVELDGFSLGGITAGAIAADNQHGYNITAIHTAGSPIGRFDIPDTVRVTSLEATQDPVATLDGTLNPDRPGWLTVRDSVSTLATEQAGQFVDPSSVHNADRYAVMAMKSPEAAQAGGIGKPAGGTITVQDYYAVRSY